MTKKQNKVALGEFEKSVAALGLVGAIEARGAKVISVRITDNQLVAVELSIGGHVFALHGSNSGDTLTKVNSILNDAAKQALTQANAERAEVEDERRAKREHRDVAE